MANYPLLTDIHTDYTSPTGTVSASGELGWNVAFKAFDQDTSTEWDISSTPAWIQYEFISPKIVYEFLYVCTIPSYWISYTLDVSDDGNNWTVVHTVLDQTEIPIDDIIIDNPTEGKYFRCSISQFYNSPLTNEIYLYGEEPTSDYVLLTDTHTGYTSPTGTASAGGEYAAGFAAWKAVDGVIIIGSDNGWTSPNSTSASNWNYTFVTPQTVHRIIMYPGLAVSFPREVTVFIDNVEVHHETITVFDAAVTIDIDTPTEGDKILLDVSIPSGCCVQISEVELYNFISVPPTFPTDDFTASDDKTDGIECIWSSAVGDEPITYALYSDTINLVDNITSPYMYIPDTTDIEISLFVKATNIGGSINSRTDNGMMIGSLPLFVGTVPVDNLMLGSQQVDCVYLGSEQIWCSSAPTPPSLVITDFNASDDIQTGVVCTWTDPADADSFNLYRDGSSIATDITSGYEDTTGTIDTIYTYNVEACDATECVDSNTDSGVKSSGTPVLIPPGPVTDFSASDDMSDGVQCTWTNPEGNPEPVYDLYRNGSVLVSNIQSGYMDTTINSGVTSSYKISASNSEGSVFSNLDDGTRVSTGFTPPSTINNFDASDDRNDGVMCTWGNAIGNPTPTHNLYRDSTNIATNVTSGYLDTTAISGITYAYYVQAVNSEGSTNSNVNSGMVFTGSPPSYITDFDASDIFPTEVFCTWSYATGDPTPYYNIYRNGSLLDRAITNNNYHDFTAAPGFTFTYYVEAVNEHGYTTSNSDEGIMIYNAPGPITSFQASDDLDTGIYCSWYIPTGYPEPTYDIYRDDICLVRDMTDHHYNDFTTEPGVPYTYYVKAINEYGESTSNSDEGTKIYNGPGPITTFNATDDLDTGVYCSWYIPTGDPEPTYNIYRDDILLLSGIMDNAYNDFTTEVGVTYTYYVKAINEHGYSISNSDTGIMIDSDK